MVSRRQFLKGSAAAAALGTLAGCTGGGGGRGTPGSGSGNGTTGSGTNGSTGGGSDTITVGSLHALAPPLTQLAKQERQGMRVAVEGINNAGGIGGRQVELVTENTQANPETGLQKARRLVESENADMLYGAIVSSTALAVTEYANQQQVPFFTNASANSLTGADCQRSTFVLNPSEVMRANAMAPTMVERSGTTGWMHIYDYSFGYSVRDGFRSALDGLDTDTTVRNVTTSPLQETDFSNAISQIVSADVDWVVLGIGGAGLATFLTQGQDFGLQEQVDVYGPEAVQSARRDAGDAIIGMITHGRYSPTYDSEPNSRFVNAYTQQYDGPPNQLSKDAWEGVHVFKAAVEEAGSTAFGDVVSAAEGVEIDSLMGSLSMRACDHRCVRPMYVSRVGQPDQYGFPLFESVETVLGLDVMRSCEQTGCTF